MKRTFKNSIRDFLIIVNPFSNQEGDRVICFHDIQDKLAFENRMIWLKQKFTIVSLESLLSKNNETNQKRIAITFDDGFESWYTNVYPVLKQLKIPATFFVNSALINLKGEEMAAFFSNKVNRKEKYLKAISSNQLLELSKNPLFEIGGHTKDHYRFSESTTLEIAKQQIIKDKITLEKLILKPLRFFAYPFGQLQNAPGHLEEILNEAGYNFAFTIVPGKIDFKTDPFRINRDSLELSQNKIVWLKWLNGSYDNLVVLKLKVYKLLSIKFR